LRYFQSSQELTSTTRDAGVKAERTDVGHEPHVPKGSAIETDAQKASTTPHPSQTAMVSHERVYSSPWYKYIVEKLTSLVENKDALTFSVKHEKGELVDKLIRLLEKEKNTRENNQVTDLIWLLKREKEEKLAIENKLQEEKKLRVCIQGEQQQTIKQLKETMAKLEQLELEEQKAQLELKEEQEQHEETKAVLASKEQEIATLLQEKDEVTEKLGEEIEKLRTLLELVYI
jgi:ABC-type uncharacterized transport system permease subunit